MAWFPSLPCQSPKKTPVNTWDKHANTGVSRGGFELLHLVRASSKPPPKNYTALDIVDCSKLVIPVRISRFARAAFLCFDFMLRPQIVFSKICD